ncbi:cytochrome P450 [Blyttiomyces helicus]|uniref:Cytochrome P450 n=1 Tax=Blyttiomyces helicus TaxID=388810 RepID=A0A4P9WCS7_9FUNG|nr:cytochrome P450 [Blyttiomyces helicus]|eukprot:RKO90461.1 cytochrome P450 [Blyttiomyces helicus]
MSRPSDTSSTLHGSLLIRPSQNLDMRARLQADLDTLPLDDRGLISNDSLKTLPYVSALLKKTLRIDPSVGGISRQLEADTLIGGYLLPKKTTLFIYMLALHQETGWTDPDVLTPERVMDGSGEAEEREGAHSMGFDGNALAGRQYTIEPIKCLVQSTERVAFVTFRLKTKKYIVQIRRR